MFLFVVVAVVGAVFFACLVVGCDCNDDIVLDVAPRITLVFVIIEIVAALITMVTVIAITVAIVMVDMITTLVIIGIVRLVHCTLRL